MGFIIGDEVVVVTDRYDADGIRIRGFIGRIETIHSLPYNSNILLYSLAESGMGTYDAEIKMKIRALTFRDGEIVLTRPRSEIPAQFDIFKYLSEDQMRVIAERIFVERSVVWIDKIIEKRGSSVFREVLSLIAEKYVKLFADSCGDDIFIKIKSLISGNDVSMKGSDIESFNSGLIYKLQDAANKWIEDNMDTVQNQMRDQILKIALQVSNEKFVQIIANQIDMRDLIYKALVNTQKR